MSSILQLSSLHLFEVWPGTVFYAYVEDPLDSGTEMLRSSYDSDVFLKSERTMAWRFRGTTCLRLIGNTPTLETGTNMIMRTGVTYILIYLLHPFACACAQATKHVSSGCKTPLLKSVGLYKLHIIL